MDQLQIGDLVATRDGKFSKIYSFGHFIPNSKNDFLQICTDIKTCIEITGDHMLFFMDTAKTSGKISLIPARDVEIEDLLLTPEGRPARVESIRKIQRRGLYAPFTEDGTIVVDGLVASNYVVLPPSFQAVATFEEQHMLQHIAYAPYRVFCALASDACAKETYDKDTGFSETVTMWLPMLNWLEHQSPLLLSIVVHIVTLAQKLRNTLYILVALVGYLQWKKTTNKPKTPVRADNKKPTVSTSSN